MWYQNIGSVFCHKARVWRTDRQTDRITIPKTALAYASRDKNEELDYYLTDYPITTFTDQNVLITTVTKISENVSEAAPMPVWRGKNIYILL